MKYKLDSKSRWPTLTTRPKLQKLLAKELEDKGYFWILTRQKTHSMNLRWTRSSHKGILYVISDETEHIQMTCESER